LLCQETDPLGDATTLLFLRMSSVSGKIGSICGRIGLLLRQMRPVLGRIGLVLGRTRSVAGQMRPVFGRIDLVFGRIDTVVRRTGSVPGQIDRVFARSGLLRSQIGGFAARIGALAQIFGVLIGRIWPPIVLSGMVGERIRWGFLPIDRLVGQIDELFGVNGPLFLVGAPVGERSGSVLGPSHCLFAVIGSVGPRIGRVWQ
jgi:hypothetical protein